MRLINIFSDKIKAVLLLGYGLFEVPLYISAERFLCYTYLISFHISMPLVTGKIDSCMKHFSNKLYLIIGANSSQIFLCCVSCVVQKQIWSVKIVWWHSEQYVASLSQFCWLMLPLIVVYFSWSLLQYIWKPHSVWPVHWVQCEGSVLGVCHCLYIACPPRTMFDDGCFDVFGRCFLKDCEDENMNLPNNVLSWLEMYTMW